MTAPEMPASAPTEPAASPQTTRAARAVVVVVTVTLAAMSVRQVLSRALPTIPYPGLPGLSAAMNETPHDDVSPWFLSAGIVDPPSANADETALALWLTRNYPGLSLSPHEMGQNVAGPALDLGGGPPRVLYVEPGRGLVARAP